MVLLPPNCLNEEGFFLDDLTPADVAARLKLEDLTYLGWGSLAFLAILILIARPASILLSTLRSDLSWQEKLFLSWMAPRGIVAAAVTSVFALELAHEAGYTQAELMVPEMFVVIVGTVTICLGVGFAVGVAPRPRPWVAWAAFGAFGWSGEAPDRIFDTMQHVFKMKMVSGPLRLKASTIGGGIQMAQSYGKEIAAKL